MVNWKILLKNGLKTPEEFIGFNLVVVIHLTIPRCPITSKTLVVVTLELFVNVININGRPL